MQKRSEIEEKYKWNLKDIYNSENQILEDIENLKTYPDVLAGYKGKLNKIDICLEFFELCTKVKMLHEKVIEYIYLKCSENMENSKFLELDKVVSNIGQRIDIATSFEESELLGYGEDYIHTLLKDDRFKNYQMSLKDFLRHKDHILSEEQEILVSKATKPLAGYGEVFDNLDNLDLNFEKALDGKGRKHEVNNSNYLELMESKDRVLRKNAMLSYTKSYNNFVNTIASNYISSVEADWFLADVYKFNSVLESHLFGDNIDNSVYTNLLENVSNYLPLVHKYYKLKKKALKYKDMYSYDVFVSLVDYKLNFNYDANYEDVINAMSVLGEEYVSGLKRARDERWIDVYPCEKKESGGYCLTVFYPHPYILLNSVNDGEGFYTLAHELGHAMHGYLSVKNQPFQTYDHNPFLGEIASSVNEIFLFKYLYKNSKNDKERLYHLQRFIINFISAVFSQTRLSEFEYFAHSLIEKGEPISKDILNNKYRELVEKYNGNNVKQIKEDIGASWMRIPHLYRPYYVFSYATGMVSAITFVNKILNNETGATQKYLTYLKSGLSDYSTNILENAGIDLTTDEPYKIAFGEFEWALNEMEKLIKKLF